VKNRRFDLPDVQYLPPAKTRHRADQGPDLTPPPVIQPRRYFNRENSPYIVVREAIGFDGPVRRTTLTPAVDEVEFLGGHKTQILATGNILVLSQKLEPIAEVPAYQLVEVLTAEGHGFLIRAITDLDSGIPSRLPTDTVFTQEAGLFAGNAGAGVIRLTLAEDFVYEIESVELHITCGATAGARTPFLRVWRATTTPNGLQSVYTMPALAATDIGTLIAAVGLPNQDYAVIFPASAETNTSLRPLGRIVTPAVTAPIALLLEGSITGGLAEDFVRLKVAGRRRTPEPAADNVVLQLFTEGRSSLDV